MAIVWGPEVSNWECEAVRIGYEYVGRTYEGGALTADTSFVDDTFKVYVQPKWQLESGADTLSGFGDLLTDYSKTVGFSALVDAGPWSPSNARLIDTKVERTYLERGSTQSYSGGWSLAGIYATTGTAYTKTAYLDFPARPYYAPDAPTNVRVTRESDGRHTISWALVAPNDPDGPTRNVVLQRRTDGGTWTTIATLGQTASYTDASTTAGHRYQWRMDARNSDDASVWAESPEVYTTPAPPSNVTAVRQARDVLVSWTKSTSPHHRTVVMGRPGTGAWQTLGTSTGTSYLVPAPDPTQPWVFAVAAQADSQGTTLTSASVATAQVQLITAPAAPTGTAPAVADAAESVTLIWQHNPRDASAQTAYELRWRVSSSAPWSGTPKTTATASKHVLPVGAWAAGTRMEWQVRTWGAHADPSEWSALVLTTVSQRPAVTLTSPTETALRASNVIVRWEFFDPEGGEQARYVVRLYTLTGEKLWERAMVSSWKAVDVAGTGGPRLQDGQSYIVGVTAWDMDGLASAEARQQIDVTYAPPPPAVLTEEWLEDTGAVVLTIHHHAPTAEQVDAATCELWRSVDGGPWQRIATGLPLDTTFVDASPHTSRATAYKVVTVSDLPSTATSPVVTVSPDPHGWIYLSAGPGFSQVVRMRDNAKTTPKWARGGALHHFAGRRRPTSIRSEHQTRSVGVSVRLAPNPDGGATWEELEEFLALADAPILYRDAKGRRWWVEVSDLSGAEERVIEEASFTAHEIDFDEGEAVAS